MLSLIYKQEDLVENKTAVFQCEIRYKYKHLSYMKMFFNDHLNQELDVRDRGDAHAVIQVSL